MKMKLKRTILALLVSVVILPYSKFTVQAAESGSITAMPGVAVVETNAGKLQGYVNNDIFTYHGIPYAKADRFMPPSKVEPWSGIRTAMIYGSISPQFVDNNVDMSGDIFVPHRYWNWPQSDNCQNLNVWTPAINDGKKRPVMVWLHGGGYQTGSSNEEISYDGENLSRKGDAVVVSVNHRLNALGFLDLSAYGDKYKYSGNLGLMDIVAALTWVKENITQFGGDPNNVTLFGQSGGGAKILTLMATPAAKGLFNKGIVESGAVDTYGMPFTNVKASKRVAELTLQNLGIRPNEVDKLQTIPYDQLMDASYKALNQTAKEQNIKGSYGNVALDWAPIMDGNYIPVMSMDSFADQAKDIPLLIGSNLTEFNTTGMFNDMAKAESDNKNNWSPEEIKARMNQQYGDKADAINRAFIKAYPEKNPADAIYVDSMLRKGELKTARLKAAQNGAPVYSYVFSWETPVMGGFAMTYHCAEIPFVFNNIKITQSATGGGDEAYALADKMSGAWINFARSGNPNGDGIPYWSAYNSKSGATMIFDNNCGVKFNHDAELMSLLAPGY